MGLEWRAQLEGLPWPVLAWGWEPEGLGEYTQRPDGRFGLAVQAQAVDRLSSPGVSTEEQVGFYWVVPESWGAWARSSC